MEMRQENAALSPVAGRPANAKELAVEGVASIMVGQVPVRKPRPAKREFRPLRRNGGKGCGKRGQVARSLTNLGKLPSSPSILLSELLPAPRRTPSFPHLITNLDREGYAAPTVKPVGQILALKCPVRACAAWGLVLWPTTQTPRRGIQIHSNLAGDENGREASTTNITS